MLGTMRQDIKLEGTSLKLLKFQVVRLTPATNQPEPEGKYFARPWNGRWNDGIERNAEDSILVTENEVDINEEQTDHWLLCC